jgi:hypothetical protein
MAIFNSYVKLPEGIRSVDSMSDMTNVDNYAITFKESTPLGLKRRVELSKNMKTGFERNYLL